MSEDLLAKIEPGRCSIRIRALLAMKEIYNAGAFGPFFEGWRLKRVPLNRA